MSYFLNYGCPKLNVSEIRLKKKAEATQIIFIVIAALTMIGLLWSIKQENSSQSDITNLLVANISNCADKAAIEIFSQYAKSGFKNQSYYDLDNGNFVDEIPIYYNMPTEEMITSFFSKEIAILTRICISKTNYAPFNASLNTNVESLKFNISTDKKTQNVVMSLLTPLTFTTKDKHTIKIGKIVLKEYPLKFRSYMHTAGLVWNHFAANRNYYLSNDCEFYKLSGISVSMAPLDTKYTYIEVRDGKSIELNYSTPYVWRGVVQTPSSNKGSC